MDKKKRYHLKFEDQQPIHAFGLVTDENEYRISWLINHHLSRNLQRIADWSVKIKNTINNQQYALYEEVLDVDKRIVFVNNKSPEGVWLTSYKQINFICIASGDFDPEMINILHQGLQQIKPEIRAVFKLNPEQLSHLPI